MQTNPDGEASARRTLAPLRVTGSKSPQRMSYRVAADVQEMVHLHSDFSDALDDKENCSTGSTANSCNMSNAAANAMRPVTRPRSGAVVYDKKPFFAATQDRPAASTMLADIPAPSAPIRTSRSNTVTTRNYSISAGITPPTSVTAGALTIASDTPSKPSSVGSISSIQHTGSFGSTQHVPAGPASVRPAPPLPLQPPPKVAASLRSRRSPLSASVSGAHTQRPPRPPATGVRSSGLDAARSPLSSSAGAATSESTSGSSLQRAAACSMISVASRASLHSAPASPVAAVDGCTAEASSPSAAYYSGTVSGSSGNKTGFTSSGARVVAATTPSASPSRSRTTAREASRGGAGSESGRAPFMSPSASVSASHPVLPDSATSDVDERRPAALAPVVHAASPTQWQPGTLAGGAWHCASTPTTLVSHALTWSLRLIEDAGPVWGYPSNDVPPSSNSSRGADAEEGKEWTQSQPALRLAELAGIFARSRGVAGAAAKISDLFGAAAGVIFSDICAQTGAAAASALAAELTGAGLRDGVSAAEAVAVSVRLTAPPVTQVPVLSYDHDHSDTETGCCPVAGCPRPRATPVHVSIAAAAIHTLHLAGVSFPSPAAAASAAQMLVPLLLLAEHAHSHSALGSTTIAVPGLCVNCNFSPSSPAAIPTPKGPALLAADEMRANSALHGAFTTASIAGASQTGGPCATPLQLSALLSAAVRLRSAKPSHSLSAGGVAATASEAGSAGRALKWIQRHPEARGDAAVTTELQRAGLAMGSPGGCGALHRAGSVSSEGQGSETDATAAAAAQFVLCIAIISACVAHKAALHVQAAAKAQHNHAPVTPESPSLSAATEDPETGLAALPMPQLGPSPTQQETTVDPALRSSSWTAAIPPAPREATSTAVSADAKVVSISRTYTACPPATAAAAAPHHDGDDSEESPDENAPPFDENDEPGPFPVSFDEGYDGFATPNARPRAVALVSPPRFLLNSYADQPQQKKNAAAAGQLSPRTPMLNALAFSLAAAGAGAVAGAEAVARGVAARQQLQKQKDQLGHVGNPAVSSAVDWDQLSAECQSSRPVEAADAATGMNVLRSQMHAWEGRIRSPPQFLASCPLDNKPARAFASPPTPLLKPIPSPPASLVESPSLESPSPLCLVSAPPPSLASPPMSMASPPHPRPPPPSVVSPLLSPELMTPAHTGTTPALVAPPPSMASANDAVAFVSPGGTSLASPSLMPLRSSRFFSPFKMAPSLGMGSARAHSPSPYQPSSRAVPQAPPGGPVIAQIGHQVIEDEPSPLPFPPPALASAPSNTPSAASVTVSQGIPPRRPPGRPLSRARAANPTSSQQLPVRTLFSFPNVTTGEGDVAESWDASASFSRPVAAPVVTGVPVAVDGTLMSLRRHTPLPRSASARLASHDAAAQQMPDLSLDAASGRELMPPARVPSECASARGAGPDEGASRVGARPATMRLHPPQLMMPTPQNSISPAQRLSEQDAFTASDAEAAVSAAVRHILAALSAADAAPLVAIAAGALDKLFSVHSLGDGHCTAILASVPGGPACALLAAEVLTTARVASRVISDGPLLLTRVLFLLGATFASAIAPSISQVCVAGVRFLSSVTAPPIPGFLTQELNLLVTAAARVSPSLFDSLPAGIVKDALSRAELEAAAHSLVGGCFCDLCSSQTARPILGCGMTRQELDSLFAAAGGSGTATVSALESISARGERAETMRELSLLVRLEIATKMAAHI